MLLHGDEMGRTQQGNNNAYCQDNELSWVDWTLVETNADLVDFTAKLTQLRRDHPVFRRRRFFTGVRGSDDLHDVAWFDTDGELMDDEDWENGLARTLAMFLNGDAITSPGPSGQQVVDDSFLLLFNAFESALDFVVPAGEWGKRWVVEFDTAENPNRKSPNQRRVTAGKSMSVEGRSAVLLRRLA
jgi:isoamylase